MNHRIRWLLSAAVGLAALQPLHPAAAADYLRGSFDRFIDPENAIIETPEKKALEKGKEKEEDKEKDNGSSRSSRFEFTPYAAVSAGYDSNFDEDVDEIDSVFQRYDLGMSVTYDHDGTFLEFTSEGIFYDMIELADPDRWEYSLGLDGRVDLSKQTRFLFGFDRFHDEVEDPQAITNEAYSGFSWKRPTRTFSIVGSLEHEINLTSDDDFGNAAADEFDYVKLTGDAKYQWWTQDWLSPFVRTKISSLDFPGQDSSFINRNGTDYAVITGVTLKLSETLEADIGGRFNHRTLDDEFITGHTNGFVDLDLLWKPSDKFRLRATIERELDEPGAEFSVVADVTEYRITTEWKPDDKVEVDLVAAFSKEEEIGQDSTEFEWALGAAGYYSMTDHLRLFSKVANTWYEDKEVGLPTDKYQRFEVRAGVETKF